MPKVSTQRAWYRNPHRRPSPRKYGDWSWSWPESRWVCVLNERGKARVAAWMDKHGSLSKFIMKMNTTRRMWSYAVASGFSEEEIEAFAQVCICEAVARHRDIVDGKPIKLITSVGNWCRRAVSETIRLRAGEPTPLAMASLNAAICSDDGAPGHLIDFVADRRTLPVRDDEHYDHDRRLRLVMEAVRCLPEREQRYLLAKADGKSLQDVADAEGITRERVRQVTVRAILRVRERLGVSPSPPAG